MVKGLRPNFHGRFPIPACDWRFAVVSLRALWARKALGGGMRQAGVIAAPMLVALKEIVPLLKDDHVRARKIAQGLFTVPEVIFF